MRGLSLFLLSILCMAHIGAAPVYEPTAENLAARERFSDAALGIFIHWGIYSMPGQGEWYLNYGPTAEEYAKLASAFYPARFDARQWADAIKDAGAEYVTFTSRHHDGFSMWHTGQSEYNIVDATPFGRDVVAELAEALRERELTLNLYYSHIDWTRPDYPSGRTGLTTGRDTTLRNWPQYYQFMNRQLRELLTGYGPIGAIWFDGWWDHDSDSIPFNWELEAQYAMIHELQPSCLVGNNHHRDPFPGEDIQIFERDIPGRNLYGYSEQDISELPLETCQTMNGMWGYKIVDQNYKSVPELIRYLVSANGKGANLLLNIGPQPNGELPATALDRLKGIGRWMERYGRTVKATRHGDFPEQPWGTSTRRGDTLFVHLLEPDSVAGGKITFATQGSTVAATEFFTGAPVSFTTDADGMTTLTLPENRSTEEIDLIDRVFVITTRSDEQL